MRRLLLLGLTVILAGTLLPAQEVLVGIYANPQARPQTRPAPEQVALRRTATAATPLMPATAPQPLTLPLVDDFAGGDPFPNPIIWESRGVFVNTTYGIDPPSLGVATFDAQDDRGQVYPHLGATPDTADVLTGGVIPLTAGQTGVVLSFFYQPGGLGDLPEAGDVLQLDFYTAAGSWQPVWTASADGRDTTLTEIFYLPEADTTVIADSIHNRFHYVAIAITGDCLHSGFRFRFSNMASMGEAPVPGRRSNCDHWHVDYIYMKAGRTTDMASLPGDVAISELPRPPAVAYSAIPAAHLNTPDAQRHLFGSPMTFTLAYRNLGWGARNVTRRFTITPGKGASGAPQSYFGGSENILNGQKMVREYTFDPYVFTAADNDADTVEFAIDSYIVTDTDADPLRAALRRNDTAHYTQAFYNYYSYDDGSAENGYGLYGAGTGNGRVAVRYTPYAADTLRGISVYFNLALDSANAKAFKIAVWSDNGGVPGTLLYEEKVDAPPFGDALNRFTTFALSQPLPVQKGQTFFIGWIQLSEAFLNIGYDANTVREGVNFYSIGNTWQASDYRGALMMRPVFGKALTTVANDTEPAGTPDHSWVAYPNPARERVTIHHRQAREGATAYRIDVYDIGGRLMLSTHTTGELSVATLPDGLYVLRVYEQEQYRTSLKLFVRQ